MKVQLDIGEILFVEFLVLHKPGRNHMTQCNIYKYADILRMKGNGGRKEAVAASMASARCNPKDKYSKTLGKVKSLGRAAKGLYPHAEQRDLRLQIWQRFAEIFKSNDMEKVKGWNKHSRQD